MGKKLPPPPPVPVYDPFEESTNLEELIQGGSSETAEDDQDRLKWSDDEVNLHRPVVTNAPPSPVVTFLLPKKDSAEHNDSVPEAYQS